MKICSKVTPLKATYQQVARLTALQQEYQTVSLEFQTRLILAALLLPWYAFWSSCLRTFPFSTHSWLMIGWKITHYFLNQPEVKSELHVTSLLMRTCFPGLAPAYCICREFWLVYLIVCSFCDWPEEIAFILFSLRSFVKGFEKISLWCVLFFLICRVICFTFEIRSFCYGSISKYIPE